MKVYIEEYLAGLANSDKLWGGADDYVNGLTSNEVSMLDDEIDELYPDGIELTQLNDILRFDQEWCNSVIGREEDDDDDD